MRFSILGLNQEKLLELKLDVIDALILNWFALFFASPGMEKKVIEKKIFGWVKISKVIEDLPVLNISSERGIKARFDIYVEKGLMERSTIQTQMGKKSFYRTTHIYELLINTPSTEPPKAKHTPSTEPPVEANQTSHAEANQTSHAEANQTSHVEANQTSHAEANQTSHAEANQTSHAEANQTSHAEANRTSHASLDDMLSKNSLINNNTAAALKNILFTKHNITLSDDFYCSAAAVCDYQNLDLQDYTEWFFKSLQNKKLGDIRNYVYKMFIQSDLLDQYRIELSSKIKDNQDHYSVCPCCGTKVSTKEYECPICQCNVKETNVEIILYHKKYLQLTDEDKNIFNKYRDDIILSRIPFQEQSKALKDLGYRFGLIDKKEILC